MPTSSSSEHSEEQWLTSPESLPDRKISSPPAGGDDHPLPGQGDEKKSSDQALPKSKRKQRSDKGRIMATPRDLHCLTWIAHQYAARLDQIQVLLSRFPDPANPFKGDLIAESTTKDQVDRWRAAKWIDYDRVLAKGPGFAWILKKGLELVELSDTYKQRKPAATRLNHIYAVNQVRLWTEARADASKLTWQSERSWRSEIDEGPYPDGILWTHRGAKIAIEVELSIKKPHEIYEKLYKLLDDGYEDEDTFTTHPEFPAIWFYVPDETVKEAVQAELIKLTDFDQSRISIAVEPRLLPPGYSRE